MGIDTEATRIETCNEGYLVDPAQWTPRVAEILAAREGLELTEAHWRVIEFMREYYEEHNIAADARFVIRFLEQELTPGESGRAALYRLFPYGYMQQACKIAGMRRPRAWSTG